MATGGGGEFEDLAQRVSDYAKEEREDGFSVQPISRPVLPEVRAYSIYFDLDRNWAAHRQEGAGWGLEKGSSGMDGR